MIRALSVTAIIVGFVAISSILLRNAETEDGELAWIECEINLRKAGRSESWKDVTRIYAVNPTLETLYSYSPNQRTLSFEDKAVFSDDEITIHSTFRAGIQTIITRATIDWRTLEYSGTSFSTTRRTNVVERRTDVVESGQCVKSEPKPVQENRS